MPCFILNFCAMFSRTATPHGSSPEQLTKPRTEPGRLLGAIGRRALSGIRWRAQHDACRRRKAWSCQAEALPSSSGQGLALRSTRRERHWPALLLSAKSALAAQAGLTVAGCTPRLSVPASISFKGILAKIDRDFSKNKRNNNLITRVSCSRTLSKIKRLRASSKNSAENHLF